MEPNTSIKVMRNSRGKHLKNHKNIDQIPTKTKQISAITRIETAPQEQIKTLAQKNAITSKQEAQNMLLKAPESIDQIIPSQERARAENFTSTQSTGLRLQENRIPSAANHSRKSLELIDTKTASTKQSDTVHTIKLSQPIILRALESKSHKTTVNEAPIHEEVVDKFVTYINKTIFSLIKKSFYLSADSSILHITLAEIITETLKDALFEMSIISDHITTSRKNDYSNNFNMQIQYLAEQIQKYNTQTIYTSPEDMLLLIKFIHQFIKENNAIFISQAMFIKLDTILKTAQSCCYAIQNENMIFSSVNAPKMILSYFRPVIDSTNNLPNIKFSYDVMHAIYDLNGYTDQILQTWQSFQGTDLYTTPANRQYGAFLTFLLIFETSIVAAAIILNETSMLYKITNPVPVIIDIA